MKTGIIAKRDNYVANLLYIIPLTTLVVWILILDIADENLLLAIPSLEVATSELH